MLTNAASFQLVESGPTRESEKNLFIVAKKVCVIPTDG